MSLKGGENGKERSDKLTWLYIFFDFPLLNKKSAGQVLKCEMGLMYPSLY